MSDSKSAAITEVWDNPKAHNYDGHFRVGLYGDLEWSVGYGALAGVGGGVHGGYLFTTSHQMKTSKEDSKSTSIIVKFDDPDLNDNFLVE